MTAAEGKQLLAQVLAHTTSHNRALDRRDAEKLETERSRNDDVDHYCPHCSGVRYTHGSCDPHRYCEPLVADRQGPPPSPAGHVAFFSNSSACHAKRQERSPVEATSLSSSASSYSAGARSSSVVRSSSPSVERSRENHRSNGSHNCHMSARVWLRNDGSLDIRPKPGIANSYGNRFDPLNSDLEKDSDPHYRPRHRVELHYGDRRPQRSKNQTECSSREDEYQDDSDAVRMNNCGCRHRHTIHRGENFGSGRQRRLSAVAASSSPAEDKHYGGGSNSSRGRPSHHSITHPSLTPTGVNQTRTRSSTVFEDDYCGEHDINVSRLDNHRSKAAGVHVSRPSPPKSQELVPRLGASAKTAEDHTGLIAPDPQCKRHPATIWLGSISGVAAGSCGSKGSFQPVKTQDARVPSGGPAKRRRHGDEFVPSYPRPGQRHPPSIPCQWDEDSGRRGSAEGSRSRRRVRRSSSASPKPPPVRLLSESAEDYTDFTFPGGARRRFGARSVLDTRGLRSPQATPRSTPEEQFEWQVPRRRSYRKKVKADDSGYSREIRQSSRLDRGYSDYSNSIYEHEKEIPQRRSQIRNAQQYATRGANDTDGFRDYPQRNRYQSDNAGDIEAEWRRSSRRGFGIDDQESPHASVWQRRSAKRRQDAVPTEAAQPEVNWEAERLASQRRKLVSQLEKLKSPLPDAGLWGHDLYYNTQRHDLLSDRQLGSPWKTQPISRRVPFRSDRSGQAKQSPRTPSEGISPRSEEDTHDAS